MIIKNHLDKKAKEDVVFAEKYNNCGKTIDDCFNYILSEAREAVAYAWPTMRSLVLLYIILTNLK